MYMFVISSFWWLYHRHLYHIFFLNLSVGIYLNQSGKGLKIGRSVKLNVHGTFHDVKKTDRPTIKIEIKIKGDTRILLVNFRSNWFWFLRGIKENVKIPIRPY